MENKRLIYMINLFLKSFVQPEHSDRRDMERQQHPLGTLADKSHHFVWVHSFYSSDNVMTKCSFNISVIHPFLSHCSALTKFPVFGKVLA